MRIEIGTSLPRHPVRINDTLVGYLYPKGTKLELEVKVAEALFLIIKQIAYDFDTAIASAAFQNVRFVPDGSVS